MDPKKYREEMMEKMRKADAFAGTDTTEAETQAADFGIDDVNALMERAGDTKAKVNDRLEAIEAINRIAFDKVAFKDYNARYVRVLKQLQLDKSSKVRQATFDRLSLSMDHETRALLQRSLSGEGDALVPNRMAASLLGLDDHASSRDALRDAVKSEDKNVRKAALRGLSSDTQSADLLESIATDQSEDIATREVAAISLRIASPKRFAKLAQKLAVDPAEHDQIKASAVAALAHSKEGMKHTASERFLSQLDKVSKETKSRALKSSISRLKTRSE